VLAAVVYVGTEMAGPGHVRHHGRGELLIGASAQSEALARALTAADIPTTVAANITEALWSKLITNCAYNALSAVANLPYGPMVAVEGATEIMTAVVDECVAVAKACGVLLPADIVPRTLAVAATMPGQYSSTAQDLRRGKPTEIDFLNGYVARKGAELGVATPTNRALQVMVKLAERSRQIAAP
jgi:2-dehydropantoate 2-reductase